MIPKKQNQKERKSGNKIKRTHIIVPLMVMLILVTIISTILEVANNIKHQTEIAEINRDIETKEEEILAQTINPGETYTVTEDGMYKITVTSGNGGDFLSYKGEKGRTVTGYVMLSAREVLIADGEMGGSALLNRVTKDYMAGGGSGYELRKINDDEPLVCVRGGYGPRVELYWNSNITNPSGNIIIGQDSVNYCRKCGLAWFENVEYEYGTFIENHRSIRNIENVNLYKEVLGKNGDEVDKSYETDAQISGTDADTVFISCPNSKCNSSSYVKFSNGNYSSAVITGGSGGIFNDINSNLKINGYDTSDDVSFVKVIENGDSEVSEGVSIQKVHKVQTTIKYSSELSDKETIESYERFAY